MTDFLNHLRKDAIKYVSRGKKAHERYRTHETAQADVKGVDPFVTRDTDPIQVLFSRPPINSQQVKYSEDEQHALAHIARNIGDEHDRFFQMSNVVEYGRAVPMSCFLPWPTDGLIGRYLKCTVNSVDDFCRQFQPIGFSWDAVYHGDESYTIKYVLRGNLKNATYYTDKIARVPKECFIDLDDGACENDEDGMAYQLFLFVGYRDAKTLSLKIIKSRKLDEWSILNYMQPITFGHVDDFIGSLKMIQDPARPINVGMLDTPAWGGICKLGFCYPVAQGDAEYDVTRESVSFPLLYIDIRPWVLK